MTNVHPKSTFRIWTKCLRCSSFITNLKNKPGAANKLNLHSLYMNPFNDKYFLVDLPCSACIIKSSGVCTFTSFRAAIIPGLPLYVYAVVEQTHI